MSEAMVVFFNPNKTVAGKAALPGAVLPKAWIRANGEALSVLEKLSCHGDTVDLQLVVFDDAEEIPEDWVGLIRELDAVTLIWHGGSDIHKKEMFDDFLKAGEPSPEGIRRATKNDFEFHHESGDDTFVNIKRLLEGRLEPQAFIDCFSRAVVLRQILDAACLVQLHRIAPESQRWKETVELVSLCLVNGSGRADRWIKEATSVAPVAKSVEKALDWLKRQYGEPDSVSDRASRA